MLICNFQHFASRDSDFILIQGKNEILSHGISIWITQYGKWNMHFSEIVPFINYHYPYDWYTNIWSNYRKFYFLYNSENADTNTAKCDEFIEL